MRILLVRHGESEGNVDERQYLQKGDQHVGLTEKGWAQAFGAGIFLKDFFGKTNTQDWPHIFLSPYQRTRETMSGILHGLQGFREDEPKLREDPRLVEVFFGAATALEYLKHEAVSQELQKALQVLFQAVYQKNQFTARSLFGDSFKDTFGNVKNFMDGTLQRDFQEGQKDFLIVTHGAVIQAFLLAWQHLRIDDKKKIGNPNNCDVICIEGDRKNWAIRKIYNGKELTAVDESLVGRLYPFSFKDLPPVPDFLLKEPH